MRWLFTLALSLVVLFFSCLVNYRLRKHEKICISLLVICFFINYYLMIVDSGLGAMDFFLRHQVFKGGDLEAMIFAFAAFLVVDFLVCMAAFYLGNLGFHLSFWRAKRKQGESFGDFLDRLDIAKRFYSRKRQTKKVGDENVITV